MVELHPSNMLRSRPKRQGLRAHVALALRILVAAALGLYALSYVRSSLRQPGGHGTRSSDQVEPELLACPPATVDWRGFVNPGPMFTGTAAIFTSDFSDTSVLWMIYALQGLGYSVSLYAESELVTDAHAFLTQAETMNVAQTKDVQVYPVSIDETGELQGDNVQVFIYICPDDLPTISGLGTANILVMKPTHPVPKPGDQAHSLDAADPAPLSTYDFLLYLSPGTYTQRLPLILPLLERLQQADMLFPLVDIISLPAAPTQTLTSDLGITMSMSRYDVQRRRLLVHSLDEFSRIHETSAAPVKLIICSWLMPGIAADLPFLMQQVAKLNIKDEFEYRDDVGRPGVYTGIAIQWHLYNPEDKPHFVATASMPTGVWVLDCTGTLAQLKGLLYGDCASVHELHASTLRFIRQQSSTRGNRVQQVIHKSTEAVGSLVRFKMLFLVHRSFSSKIIRFFMRSTQSAYRARLTPAIQAVRARTANQLESQQRNAAVIVEARPHYGFLYVVLNAAWYLPGWKLHVVHSRMNAGFVRRLLEPHVAVTYHQLEADNVDIDDYNGLMKNASFWQMFGAEHLLLFQTDSLILRYGLEQYTQYDYVGAPWHQENERWSQPQLRAALPEGVGNGGFSMRSVKAMVEIASNHSTRSPIKEQEDVFYAVHIQNHPTLVLADRKLAYRFCLEVPCSDLPEIQPLALHAAWFYTNHATMQKLLDTSLLGLLDCSLRG